MSVASSDLRNVAIVGHNGTGKTTLLEQMLFYGDQIARVESVESGKTTSDYMDDEIARQISIHTAMASFPWHKKTLTVLDTPGTADFIGEVILAFRSCETALVTVDGRDGAQIETIKLWRRLQELNKGRIVFINKMDRERANFNTTLEHLREQFGVNFVPVTIPMGDGENFQGVIDVLKKVAYFIDAAGKERQGDIPAEYQDVVEEHYVNLVESAAEGADDLMEKYFEEGSLEYGDICRGILEGIVSNSIVPTFCGSSIRGSGITSLLDFIADNLPSPLRGSDFILKSGATEEEVLPIDPDKETAAFVFKTTIDQYSGKLCFVKVVQGALTPESELFNPEVGKKERPGKLYRMVGKKLEEVDSLAAGDIGVITRSNIAKTNASLLHSADMGFEFAPLHLPEPVYTLAISANDKKSQDRMTEALNRISEEDLTFRMLFNEETKELTAQGMGERHITMILEKVMERQKISIQTKLPKVAFRETITRKSGQVEYTHKKQSGGHGQYGRVVIEIEPLERGQYYQFTNAIRGGAVSRNYMPGVEKGLIDAMEEGFLAGYPLVDVAISIVDGKEHSVDSSEMAFRLAGKGAMKSAFEKAGVQLLEPIMSLNVYVEDQYLGDILSDLSSKRGRVLGQEDFGGGIQMVRAEVPQAEMLNYAIDLKSMTSGTGSFELEFDHYETISGRIADEIIRAAKEEREAE